MEVLQKHRGQAEAKIPPPCHSRMPLSGIQKVLIYKNWIPDKKFRECWNGSILKREGTCRFFFGVMNFPNPQRPRSKGLF